MANLPGEEGKLLSEALNTVKIQVQQMKRYLVRIYLFSNKLEVTAWSRKGTGPAHGCAEKREFDVS